MDTSNTSKKSTIILGIILTLLLLFIGPFFSFPVLKSITTNFEGLFIVSRFYYWICLGLIYLYVSKIEKQKFLLWPETNYSVLEYIQQIFITFMSVLGVVFVVSLLLMIFKLNNESVKLEQLNQIMKNNIPLIVFTSITAGVTEELIFRGYLIPRFELFMKHKILPSLLSSLIFGLIHFGYGTLPQIIGPFFIGLTFALFYKKYKSIHVVIMCHFLWDVMAIMIQTNAPK